MGLGPRRRGRRYNKDRNDRGEWSDARATVGGDRVGIMGSALAH